MAKAGHIEQTRTKVQERGEKLTPKAAQKLFEAPFETVLEDLDAETREEIFLTAREEVDTLMNGTTSWNAVFNTYVEIAELIEVIRADHAPAPEEPLTDLALEVFSAQNRLSALFYVLRTHKEMSEAQGRSVLQAAFPLAIQGLSEEAKLAIFSYVYERNSGLGWGQVAEEYTKLMELVTRVKPDTVGLVEAGE
jgi:hypothetical protein